VFTSAPEAVGTLQLTINRLGGSDGSVSVDVSALGGSATAGDDFLGMPATLTLADGETVGSVALQIVDDGDVESDEIAVFQLANATGGASIGPVSQATVLIVDNDTGTSGDADGDTFVVPADCNDADAGMYPGATEIKHDGIDQDCNGFDLTIDITRARYLAAKDKLIIWATSARGSSADLSAEILLQDGSVVTRPLRWKDTKNRWQRSQKNFASKYGSPPVSLSVQGAEGNEAEIVDIR
jgi:hypothetical protein